MESLFGKRHYMNYMSGVRGCPVQLITNYTFTNVTANHTIAATFAINTPSLSSDYFYDDLGRLARVMQGTSGVIYTYDELGNLVSTTSTTTSGAPPVLTAINPHVLFVGSRMLVTITGQNLLTTDTVTAEGGLVSIKGVIATDTRITAEMTALAAGSETIKVATRSGATATINITLSSSTLSFSPGQLALTPATSGALTATISPPINSPLTININNNATSIVSVPQTVTIPASGSVSITVNALQVGVATIGSGGLIAVVFVANPFVWDVNENVLGNSANVSVLIDSPLGTSPISASSVSVAIEAPYSSAVETAAPVSVIIDAPAGTSPTVSEGVSVKIQ